MNTRQLSFDRVVAFAGWLPGSDEPLTSDDWFTPPELADSIRDFLGGDIDLDPCASPHAYVNARVQWTKADDGLSLPWVGTIQVGETNERHDDLVVIRNRFVNPPYSNPGPWLQRLADMHNEDAARWRGGVGAMDVGAGDSVALVKADASTKAWRHAWTADAVLFFARRVQFVRHGSTVRASAPFPSALLYWGPHAEGFDAWFADLGHVCMPTPMQIATEAVERAMADADTAVDDPIVDLGPTRDCTCPAPGCEKHPIVGPR